MEFITFQEDCFKKLYKLAEWPDWKKGMRVWQDVFSYAGDTVKEINPLKNECCEPRPEIDLKTIKKSNKLMEHLPKSVKPVDQEEGDEVKTKRKKGTKMERRKETLTSDAVKEAER